MGRAFESPQARQEIFDEKFSIDDFQELGFQSTIADSRKDGPLAQLVEQLTLNQRATGSSPVRPTIRT